MRTQMITGTLALAMLASVAVVQVAHGQRPPAERQATPGMAASGEVLSDNGRELRLNTTPCRDEASVIVFHNQYAKDPAGEVNCRGARRSLVQVVQR